MELWEPVTIMLREKLKEKKTKSESTEGLYRDGSARSSNEALEIKLSKGADLFNDRYRSTKNGRNL